jgi:23S rRNA (guanine745-N1)-methyltransferase
MLPELLDALRCPTCRGRLASDATSLLCDRGHRHDVARQGYVNLLGARRPPGPGDTPTMLDLRAAFLDAGHYAPIAEGVAVAVDPALEREPTGIVVDVGAGTGWYLSRVLDRRPGRAGLAVDIARAAAQRAARSHPRVGAIVADAWGPLPIGDGVAACVLSVFAPRNGPEFRRILSADGVLAVVSPTPAHLAELVRPLGLVSVDPDKAERLEAQLGQDFVLERQRTVRWHLDLDHEATLVLVAMGPSGHHLTAEVLRTRIARLPQRILATAEVTIASYRPRAPVPG